MRITNVAIVAVIVAAVHPGANHRASACRFLYPPLEEKYADSDVVFLGEIVSWVEEPGSSLLHIRVHVIEAWKGIAAREIGIWGQRGSSCSISLAAGLQIFHFGGIDSVDGQIWTGLYALRALHEVDELARLGYAPLELINGPDPSFLPPSDCNGNGLSDAHDIADGTSEDCTANGIPDECEADCNGNGIADGCDIASGTSQDRNGNGVPGECEPELISDTYISVLACDLTSASFATNEDVTVDGVTATITGDDRVPGVTVTYGGSLQVELYVALQYYKWLRLDVDVTGVTSGRSTTLTVFMAHTLLDVNGDGRTNILDATAFGAEFNGGRDPRLIDMNCDGRVDIRDATAFGEKWVFPAGGLGPLLSKP